MVLTGIACLVLNLDATNASRQFPTNCITNHLPPYMFICLGPRPVKVHGGYQRSICRMKDKTFKVPDLGPTRVVTLGLLAQHAV